MGRLVKRRQFGASPYNLWAELKKAVPTMPDVEISSIMLLADMFPEGFDFQWGNVVVRVQDHRIIGVGIGPQTKNR